STCLLADVACLCKDLTFISSVETCVKASCIVEDALVVKNASATACGIESTNASPNFAVTSIVMCGLAIFFTIMRIIYRQWLTQLGLGADDWTTIITALSCILAAYLNTRMAEYGVGQDIWTLTPYQITMFGQMFWYLAMVYFLDIALLKLSILFFFLRIFPDATFRRIIWITIVVVGLFGAAYVLAAMFQCWPISYNWTKWNDRDNQGQCVDYARIAWANAAVGIALDFWILYLPLSQISTLNMDWRKKLGISAMFVVGTFVTIVSIVRLASLIQFNSSDNVTHDTAGIAMWSTVEITTGVICTCMPTMRLILVRLWPNIFGSRSSTKASDGPYPPRSGGGFSFRKRGTAAGDGGSHPQQAKRSTTHRSGSRFSSYGRPTSFFSGQNREGAMTSLGCPDRLERLESMDDDAIQLRPNVGHPSSPVYLAESTSTSSSELYLSGSGADQQGIKVVTTVEVKH
ncbi:uncharacterized protein B0I36DRAFT_250182, partial [Microdochium trichocladiopsis]